VLSQDKSFAISIDRGNREDAKMVPAIDEAVKRQVREVSVPTTDTYRLAIAGAYAVANSQGATAALTSSNTFAKILDQRAALINAKVKTGNMVIFLGATVEAYLWLDTTFKAACDKSTADKASGQIGTVMGMDLIVVPDSYLPSNFGFIMMAKDVLIAPTKFNKIKTMDGDSFGIDGMVGFGRRYYDCFITANSGLKIRYHKVA